MKPKIDKTKFGSPVAGKVQAFLTVCRPNVIRLALRPDKPHLYLLADLRIMRQMYAEDFFAALRHFAD